MLNSLAINWKKTAFNTLYTVKFFTNKAINESNKKNSKVKTQANSSSQNPKETENKKKGNSHTEHLVSNIDNKNFLVKSNATIKQSKSKALDSNMINKPQKLKSKPINPKSDDEEKLNKKTNLYQKDRTEQLNITSNKNKVNSLNPQKNEEEIKQRKIHINKVRLGTLKDNTELNLDGLTSLDNDIYDLYIQNYVSMDTKNIINKERRNLCNNYAPLPVVLKKGNGIYVQDIDGNWYMDFLAGYSAVNHGHQNQKIIESAYTQMKNIYMTSRAFYNEVLGKAAEAICKMFQYEKVLFMNSGVEAGESAIKIARRWGYDVKGIPDNQAKIVFAKQNFWGRTLYACGSSDDSTRYNKFGPFDDSSRYLIEYNNIKELDNILSNDSNICAVFLEPIQGEGGVIIPDGDYLTNVKTLCEKHNCLLIVDEIQTGIGRTGHLLYSEASNIKPDIILLGKSLSGGLYPISAVLSNKKIMDLIKPGEHGSTYGGNPLAAQILIAALEEVNNLNLVKNSREMGIELAVALKELKNCKFIKEIRGRGLILSFMLIDTIVVKA